MARLVVGVMLHAGPHPRLGVLGIANAPRAPPSCKLQAPSSSTRHNNGKEQAGGAGHSAALAPPDGPRHCQWQARKVKRHRHLGVAFGDRFDHARHLEDSMCDIPHLRNRMSEETPTLTLYRRYRDRLGRIYGASRSVCWRRARLYQDRGGHRTAGLSSRTRVHLHRVILRHGPWKEYILGAADLWRAVYGNLRAGLYVLPEGQGMSVNNLFWTQFYHVDRSLHGYFPP